MCDRHEVVLSNGAWTETFRPSGGAMLGVWERAREELIALFPGLCGETRAGRFAAARRPLDANALRGIRA